MSKIAFLYPGQGAQVAGMGKDFYEQSPLAKEVFDKSCEILGQDMKHICFEENELLDRTDYTQAALVTTCMAMTKEIMARGLTPDMTAGLSLGEYCAITTAGGWSLRMLLRWYGFVETLCIMQYQTEREAWPPYLDCLERQ